MAEQTLTVTGMSCGGCESAVESALESIPDVAAASADNTTDSVRIETTSPVSASTLANAVTDAGYELTN